MALRARLGALSSVSGLLGSKRWDILDAHPDKEELFVRECGVSRLVARTLAARGFTSVEQVKFFLTPSLERDWEDPRKIYGMSAAAQRVWQAIKEHQCIAVFGDFDVDGMSATCLLTLALQELSADVHPYIPHRFGEGYGLSKEALQRVIEGSHPELVITVDNGIAAKEEVAWLLEQGIDVVVTDHHEPAELVPERVAVTDPKLGEDGVSRELAGAGVALKLVQLLGEFAGRPSLWRDYTEIASLGTVSDMMLLEGENRALVSDGIARLRQTQRPGIRALAATAGVDISKLCADELPFSLIPRLNAAGRMGTTDIAFNLLMCNDPVEASNLAAQLEQINTERREIEATLSTEALAKVGESFDGSRVIVVGGEGWHEGVKGIVASRITNRFHVPSILFSIQDGIARGSGRSVGSVNLFHAVEQCSDVLIRFGGHAGAVGVTCAAERLDEFRCRLENVMEQLPEEQFIDKGEVTACVGLDELSVASINSLEVLQPFGQGNKRPLFASRGVCMKNRSCVGATGSHLRFTATNGIDYLSAIMFRTPHIERAQSCDEAVDLVFEPVSETWQGRTKPKLMIRDILYRDPDKPATHETKVDSAAYRDSIEARDDSADICSDSAEAYSDSEGAPSSSSQRSSYEALSYGELSDVLRQKLIGDHPLLPAQSLALEQLAQGQSSLCVMATGRGKSLIFHLHAAREALLHHKASIFVYPLRALVNDQAFQPSSKFEELGLRVCVLSGETQQHEREERFGALARGAVDIVLTTPEFLQVHVEHFAQSARIGFMVIDEAHHACEPGGTRLAYRSLPSILSKLGNPVVLAVTATATEAVAQQLCELLSIDSHHGVIVDSSVRSNLQLVDARDIRDRDTLVTSLVASGQKSVIYVNSREQAESLVKLLRKHIPDLAPSIAFYHAGLAFKDRRRVEQLFRVGRLRTIVSTSAFGEGVNIADIRNVMLYHLPFGFTEFNQMSGRAGRDGDLARIYLLFGSRDSFINQKILEAAAPSRAELVAIYKALRSLAQAEASLDDKGQPSSVVLADNATIQAWAQQIDTHANVDKKNIDAALGIFSELGFIHLEEGFHTQEAGSSLEETNAMQPQLERRIVLEPAPRKMYLEDSIRYCEAHHALEAFEQFCGWAFSTDEQEALERINRPITPGFGHEVHV